MEIIGVSDQIAIHTSSSGDVICEVLFISERGKGLVYSVEFLQHPRPEFIGKINQIINLDAYDYTIIKKAIKIEPSEIYQLNDNEINELVTIFKEYSGKSI